MPISYSRMRNTAKRLLSDNGISYSVTRKGSVQMIDGEEVTTQDVTFNAVGVKTEYNPQEINGTVIIAGDVRLTLTADAEIKIGDIVTIDEAKYRVVNPNPVKPADILICYKAQLRR